MPSQNDSIEIRLEKLRQGYLASLPDKINVIVNYWQGLKDTWEVATLVDMHRATHSIAGSGATFGVNDLSQIARELEQILKSLIEDKLKPTDSQGHKIASAIENMRAISLCANELHPIRVKSTPHEVSPAETVARVYLVEDDRETAEDIRLRLDDAGFEVSIFLDITSFLKAYAKERPCAVIMDMVFPEDDEGGAKGIEQIKDAYEIPPPVIFVSQRNDLKARLAAVKAGAQRYFTKPVDHSKLISTIEGLTLNVPRDPYRVLIVDDEEALAQYYATILESSGFRVEVLTHTAQALEVLGNFSPDLVLMDVYMPECSGLELASVIRQDDTYAHMPIVFLSTERDLDKQLIAMNLGGDDFITKPVEPHHLVAAVTARVKRARWLSRLQRDLKKALEENQAQQVSLEEQKNLAEQANRAKSEFLSRMSHELRTPLNAILGFGQLLEVDDDPVLSPHQQEHVREILHAGKHLLELINEILDLAKIEAGKMNMQIEPVLLVDVLNDCEVLVRQQAEQRSITIDLQIEAHAGITVLADRMRIKQVLLNLLSNAIKYNHQNGSVTVHSRVKNRFVRIDIRDTGPGLSDEHVEGLFTAFNRLEADKSEIQGTGIGLVITKRLVEMMGGIIGVESQPGKGSTFWFQLKEYRQPVDLTPGVNFVPQALPVVQNTGANSFEVLYVEDHPANLKLISKLLAARRPDINLLSATTPEEGIRLLQEKSVDLILLDINLPGMTGLELLEKIQQLRPGIPAIAVSANAMRQDIDAALAAGFSAYLTKPVDVNQFFEQISQFL